MREGAAPVGRLIISPADLQLARERAIRGARRPRQAAGVWTRIEKRVAEQPDAIAVSGAGAGISYAELAALVRKHQQRLVAHGVSPGDSVAIAGPRGAEVIAAFLAVEHLGAVYVPLDTGWPVARLAEVLADVRPRCLIHTGTEDPARSAVIEAAEQIGTAWTTDAAGPVEIPPARTPPADEPRYVIHTSGSTGRPKGALVAHGGLVNHLDSMIEMLELTRADTVAFTAPLGYVVSVWQMTAALLAGGSVAVIDDLDVHFGRRLVNAVNAAEATVLEVVPTMIRWIVDDIGKRPLAPLPALRCLLSTGEKLSAELADAVPPALPHVTLLNAYGASECSDDVALSLVSSGGAPALGAPLPNVVLHVLVAERDGWRPAVPGEAGELWVGGVGVGLGYLHDPDRTEDAFFTDPIDPDSITGRLYRTGDLVRVSEGRIDYLGREDRLIKIGGMRIELDEIELALAKMPQIKDCAAVAQQASGRIDLVMFYVAAGADPPAMQSHLRSLLPASMIPRRWVALEALPLNGSGKVDRRALQEQA